MEEPWRESDAERRFDAKLAALAAAQHVVFSLAQCEAIGLTARSVQRRTASRRLHRIHRGVYSLVPADLLSREGRFMAAVLACGPGAVLSHQSSALLHGLVRTAPAAIDVTAPTHRGARGVRVHRSLTITDRDTTLVNAIPCTTIARALLDLGDDLNLTEHERALNQTQAMGRLRLRALDDQLQRNPTRSAASNLRRALTIYRPGQGPVQSRLEADFLSLIRAHHLPEPERQIVLDLEDGGPPIRVDFMWPGVKAIVETDGRKYHATDRAFESDRRRDQRLARAGWRCVRVTWRQVHDEPAWVVGLVADLLAG
jgi:very-short-patch-repair endonuclease/predicted transcriptional regulator of viral defense system